MKIIYILILFFSFFTNLSASEFADLGNEIRVPLPANWEVVSDSNTFPFQIINFERSAELLIYKSIIDKNETIQTNDALKESVDIIIEEIILSLPHAKLLSSTGKMDDNRAIFSLDFTSIDTTTTGLIYQRLNGYLYSHPNGEQILFTLWGKANSENKEILHNEIYLMQNNLSYFGESQEFLYQANQNIGLNLFIIIIIVIVAILLFFKKYKDTSKINYSEDSHFWRCTCGRQNHLNSKTCNRCGQRKQPKELA